MFAASSRAGRCERREERERSEEKRGRIDWRKKKRREREWRWCAKATVAHVPSPVFFAAQ
jgi:hypothetical protein